MNLRIFFDSLNEDIFSQASEPALMLHQVQCHRENFPDWQQAKVAIIGVPETRGTSNKATTGPDEIRKKFYRLKKTSFESGIVDLGNLRIGIDLIDSYLRIKEVCSILLQNNVVPLILGGGHDLDYGQFLAYEDTGKHINFLNVDAFIDMYANAEFGMNRHHINKVLMHENSLLFHYSHLAYQTYLCDKETLNVLEKLYFELYRLGRIRENFKETEPIIRNADLLSFDITAIKQNDAPGNNDSQPFGLSGEEACQICWYAGMSSKMTSAGFYEYNPEQDVKGQTAGVVATMMWYFIDGFSKRAGEFNSNDPHMMKYIVALQEEPHKLTFFKHNLSEEWWVEVPYATEKAGFARNAIIPCSYSDYELANKGEIPNRWFLTHAKLM
jgi:formiminoglutamase